MREKGFGIMKYYSYGIKHKKVQGEEISHKEDLWHDEVSGLLIDFYMVEKGTAPTNVRLIVILITISLCVSFYRRQLFRHRVTSRWLLLRVSGLIYARRWLL